MRLVDNQVRNFFIAGLIRPIDVIFTGVFLLECMTLVYWKIFGSPAAEQLIVVFLATIAYLQLWLLLVVLRIGVMILRARADINLMPETAARLAAQALTPAMAAGRAAGTPAAR